MGGARRCVGRRPRGTGTPASRPLVGRITLRLVPHLRAILTSLRCLDAGAPPPNACRTTFDPPSAARHGRRTLRAAPRYASSAVCAARLAPRAPPTCRRMWFHGILRPRVPADTPTASRPRAHPPGRALPCTRKNTIVSRGERLPSAFNE